MNTLPVPADPLPPSPRDPGANYSSPDEYAESHASPFHVQRLLVFLRRFWWLPIVTLALCLGCAATHVIYFATPNFVSQGTLWETEKLRLPEGAAFTGDLLDGTQLELLQSPKLYFMALQRLEAAMTNGIPRGKDGKPIHANVKATQRPKSTIFMVEASSPNPEFSEVFLNALMNELVTYKKNIRKTVSGDTLSSISEQVLRLERDLKNDQATLIGFTRTNNLAILQEEATTAGGYLARLKTQLSDLELEARLLDASAVTRTNVTDAASTGPFPVDPLRLSANSSSSSAIADGHAALREIELLRISRSKLSRYLKPKHPKIVRIDSEIERGLKIAELYRNQSRDQLASARQAVGMKNESVRASIKEWEAKVVDYKAVIAEAERLRQNIGRSQGLYDRLVLMLQNVDISRSIYQDTLAILQPASAAIRSYAQEQKVVGLSAFAGLALGCGVIFLILLVDDRFNSASEITEKFGNGLVGQVPEVTFNGTGLLQLKDADQQHVYAESYRSLRSAILYSTFESEKPKIILVTSALPNEGKSTVAVNLAKTLAHGDARVLLVDGDLRKGSLHQMMGLDQGPGFAELLENSSPYEPSLQTNSLPNLRFLPSGHRIGNAGDLFLGKNLDTLLSRWRRDFDHVIIDSTPVFAADDVATLAPKVDGTLLVVRNRFARAAQVREALELLFQRRAKVLGLIFNRANLKSRAYYHYKYKQYYTKKA
jgi:capsular exopolysaccharide synthesis family protein